MRLVLTRKRESVWERLIRGTKGRRSDIEG
jgi:hypothetical protein